MGSAMLLLLGIYLCAGVIGYQHYRHKIPNGDSVFLKCPHYGDVPWGPVGHFNTNPSRYGRQLNRFGQDFINAGLTWTPALCNSDSDRDGITNGWELGDPKCEWKKGETPQLNATSHPGLDKQREDYICWNSRRMMA